MDVVAALRPDMLYHRPCREMPSADTTFCVWTGWISPDGTFYPCGFAEHQLGAGRIMFNCYNSEYGDILVYEDPMFYLIKRHGWIATRYSDVIGCYVHDPVEVCQDFCWRPTVAQITTLRELAEHWDVIEVVPDRYSA